ncbi:MAG: hypothetical protein KDK64_04915, partial [Chlamydiia bacterium]|nr:hypothetical protein [Chlamydiia bacterium]
MDINGYDTESLYDNDYFSPLKGGKEVEWGFGSIKDRKYIAFPVNKSYYSETKHGEVYHQFHCMSCGSELTDIFDRYVIEVSPDSYYCCDEDFEEASNKLNKVGMQFIRTCIPCFYSEDCGKIFAWKSKGYITYLGETRQFYVVNIGFTEKNYFLGNYQTVSSSEGKTFHQRLGAFLDNFDAGLADINESLIAGFFRTFGVIRDSVDFFVTVGELLKQKVGLSEPKEKELFASQYKLSEETANALMHIDKVTPLEIFRRIFPTG